MTSKVVAIAARRGHLDMLQFLSSRVCKTYFRGAAVEAAANNQLPVLKWLVKEANVRLSNDGYHRVARNGHLDNVKWLFAKTQYSWHSLSLSISFSFQDILEGAAERG